MAEPPACPAVRTEAGAVPAMKEDGTAAPGGSGVDVDQVLEVLRGEWGGTWSICHDPDADRAWMAWSSQTQQ